MTVPSFKQFVILWFSAFFLALPSQSSELFASTTSSSSILNDEDEICLELDSLEIGEIFGASTGYDPGDIFHEEEDVLLKLREFKTSTGTSVFGEVEIMDGGILMNPDIKTLWTNNVNILFDFHQVHPAPTSFSFDFYYGGGDINLAVNGRPIQIFTQPDNFPIEIAPGVFLNVELWPTALIRGTATLTGLLHNVTVGGQEFAVGNFCYTTRPQLFTQCLEFEDLDDGTNYSSNNGYNTADTLLFEEKHVRVTPGVASDNNEIFITTTMGAPFLASSGNYIYLKGFINFDFDYYPYTVKEVCFDFKFLPDPNNLTGYFQINGGQRVFIQDLIDNDSLVTNLGFRITVDFLTNTQEGRICIAGHDIRDIQLAARTLLIDNVCVSALVDHPPASSDCVDFESTPEGTHFGFDAGNIPGDTILEEDSVFVSIHPFEPLGGPIAFGNGWVDDDPPGHPLDNQYAFVNRLNLKFDFGWKTDSIHLVSFDVIEGGPVNFGVNAGDVEWYQALAAIPLDVAPGVEFRYFPDLKKVVITGNIRCFTFGGVEIGVDNVCFSGARCLLFNPRVLAADCDQTNQTFFAKIDFDYAGVGDIFLLDIAGFGVQTFEYAQLPVVVGPLPANGQDIKAIVKDIDNLTGNVNCEMEFVIPGQICGCTIRDLKVFDIECNADGNYNFSVNFTTSNPTDDHFDLFINGEFFGFFALDDLPVRITDYAPNSLVLTIQACINDNPDCCSEALTFTLPPCGGCQIRDIIAETTPCNPNGVFFVELDFKHVNTSDSFVVVGNNGIIYGVFAYDDLPIKLGPFPGDGTTVYELFIVDKGNPDCRGFFEFGPVDCSGNCGIKNLEIFDIECTSDGKYNFSINFDAISPTNAKFDLFINGEFYDFFSLNDLPIRVKNYMSNSLVITIQVCINDNPNCCSDILTWQLPNCGNCRIADLVAEAHPCDNNGQFLVDLDFKFANTSDSFTVKGNGVFYGTFAYDDLFLTLGPFYGDCDTEYEFVVQDKNNPDCSDYVVLGPICCDSNCRLFDLKIVDISCHLDNPGYSGILKLKHQNTGGLGFDLFQDGEFIGFFHYDDLPIFLPNINGDPGQVSIFTACDNDNPNCCTSFTLEFPPCGDCKIKDLEVFNIECDDHGNYSLCVNFNHLSNSGKFFIILDNQEFGPFEYGDLPVCISGIDGYDPGQVAKIQVCDAEIDNCCSDRHPITFPDCDGNCMIRDLEVFDVECSDDGNGYNFCLNFHHDNTSGKFFVLIDNEKYGPFEYGDLPVCLHNIQYGPGDKARIRVCDAEFPVNCCSQTVVIEFPPCNDDCRIWDLEVFDIECHSNGTYSLCVDFHNENTSGKYFVYLNNEKFGPFDGNAPICLNNIDGYAPGDIAVIQVCDAEDPDCCSEFLTFIFPPCGGDCDIRDLEVFDIECQDDGTYSLCVKFISENTSGKFFVISDNQRFGPFPYTNTARCIKGIEGYEPGDVARIIVCDAEFDHCCSNPVEIEFPDCDTGPCVITNLMLEAFCVNGEPFLEIKFNSTGNSDSFFVNSCFLIGGFEYNSTNTYVIPITDDLLFCAIGGFIPIGVFDSQHGDSCFAVGFVAIPNCEDECMLSDLRLEATDCDGDFFNVVIDFEFKNTSDSFVVIGNGQVYGTFSYDDLPIDLGPFLGDGLTVYEFGIIDLGNLNCALFGEIGPIDCSPCELSNLRYEVECMGDTAYIEFIFDYTGVGDSFDLYTCAGVDRSYAYGQSSYVFAFPTNKLPCFFGNLIPFTIFDRDDPNTCFLLEFIKIPDCSDKCSIYDLVVEKGDCDDQGKFFVELDFKHQKTGPNGFLVFVNGMVYGPFAYSDLPIKLGPFAGDGTSYEFLVLDFGDPLCFGYFDLGSVDCEDECAIADLEVEVECDDDDEYIFKIDFEHTNTQSDSFDVFFSNQYTGTFAYDDLPVAVEGLIFSSNVVVVRVCEQDNSDCCEELEVELPSCFVNLCISLAQFNPNVTVFNGTEYDPGDFIFEIDDVDFYISENNDPAFSIHIQNVSDFESVQGNHFLAGGSLKLDFTDLEALPTYLEFKVDGGISILGANGHGPMNVHHYPGIDTTIQLTPDVIARVTEQTAFPGEYYIFLEGLLKEVEIGNIDNYFGGICLENNVDVWPGDANFNNIADQYDLLNLGLAYGTQGPARKDTSTSWQARPSDNWDDSFADGTNYKHADCNGNGEVGPEDLSAISANFGLSHGPTPALPASIGGPEDPLFYIDLPDVGEVEQGETIIAPIIMGTLDVPVNDLYGLAFRVNFDPDVFSDSRIEMASSWFATGNNDLIDLFLTSEEEGVIEGAASRIDQINASGSGVVGYYIGIIDDLTGYAETEVEITNVKAIDNEEEPVPLYLLPGNFQAPGEGENQLTEDVLLYPNPTDGLITIQNISGGPIQSIEIHSLIGRNIVTLTNPGEFSRIDGSKWPSGIYYVKVRRATGITTKKVKIARP